MGPATTYAMLVVSGVPPKEAAARVVGGLATGAVALMLIIAACWLLAPGIF